MIFIHFFIFRFLLKSLLQYQSLSEGELLPTPSSSAHLPLPPVALSSGPSGASGLSTTHSVSSTVPTGEEGALKKPKKERKERGRENGKDERECYDEIFIKTENDILVLLYTTKLCWNWAFSSKEDVQEEKTRRWLTEGGATHPSGLFWPSCLSHSTGRFDSLQSGWGQCLSESKPLSWGFKVPIFSWNAGTNDWILLVCSPDHHRQNAVSWRVCHLPSGLLQHAHLCQHEKPRAAVPLHLPNQGWGNRPTGQFSSRMQVLIHVYINSVYF